MRIPVFALLSLGLALRVQGEQIETNEEDGSLINCMFEDNTLACMAARTSRDIDRIEFEVTGKKSEVPMSAAIEQAGNFVAEVIGDIQDPERSEAEESTEDGQQEEGRGKKLGKKKKKQLQKLLGVIMMFKAKISLLLQLVSTHLQFKFFGVAIIGLLINAARFWLELKNSHPAKVIYYEHAQHQHHYDHDEHEHGAWGRSSNDNPQDLAYSGHATQH